MPGGTAFFQESTPEYSFPFLQYSVDHVMIAPYLLELEYRKLAIAKSR